MPNETNTEAPAQSTEMPSPTQETPNSIVENIPQEGGDFATWLSDRLDKFQKGEETAPWEQAKTEPAADEKKEESVSDDAISADKAESKDPAEATSDENDPKLEDESKAEDEDTKNMSSSAGAKFKELKSELKTYKTRVAELERAVEESRSKSSDPQEVETLKAKLADYEKELAIGRVEASPEYKRAVLEPTQAILDAASNLAERYKIEPRKLVNALREESLSEGSDALTELAADFSERDRVRMYRMADDLLEVSRRRDYLRENAAAADKERQERLNQEQARAKQEYMSNVKAVSEKTWENTFASNEIIKGLDKAVLEEVQRMGSSYDMANAAIDDQAYAAYAGVILPHLVKQLESVAAKSSELEKALSKYKKAAPKASGNADTSVSNDSPGGFLEAVEKRFGS